MEDEKMPSTNQPRKIEKKIGVSQATADFVTQLSQAKDTPETEIYRQAIERGLTEMAKDETSRNVWQKTSLRGELGRLISGMDEDQMDRAIQFLRSVTDG